MTQPTELNEITKIIGGKLGSQLPSIIPIYIFTLESLFVINIEDKDKFFTT